MTERIVVITGAATGLGLSLAKQFLDHGDAVFGVTLTKRHWPKAKKLLSHRSRFFLDQADVTQESEVKHFVNSLQKRAGRIDILINNAGYAGRTARIEEETLEEFEKNITSNLTSTFLMCKYTVPIFRRQQSGWIINISSMAGKRAVPLLSAYSASKFGVVALSQAVAKENRFPKFRCITICPGGMNTVMRAKLFGEEDAKRQQSPDYVAEKILDILDETIEVESGGDVVIRYGAITAINPPPNA